MLPLANERVALVDTGCLANVKMGTPSRFMAPRSVESDDPTIHATRLNTVGWELVDSPVNVNSNLRQEKAGGNDTYKKITAHSFVGSDERHLVFL